MRDFISEPYIGDLKIGYVVVEKLDDLILAKTFLFLTMDGTPEGTKLWKRLRLDRSGKEYTGLDRLSTYLDTDLALDEGLVTILEECGCGHLFQMRREFHKKTLKPGYAAEIRKYLRLDDWQPPSKPTGIQR